MLSVARCTYQAEPPRHQIAPRQYFDLKLLFFSGGDERASMAKTGLGEREIIQQLTRRFAQSGPKLPLGFDDDVSVFPISSRSWLVLKTDSLVGSTDVPPGMSLEQASRKAIVATVSDFAAKGVQPVGLLISLSLRPPVSRRIASEIARGIFKASGEYHTRVIGGDTGESKDLIIDCIGFGLTQPRRLIRRDRAKPGDIIMVTGNFGKTMAGLRILLSKRKKPAARFRSLVYSVIHPVARLETGLKLAMTGIVNSSIDSSDGLAWSLHEIARLSKVKMVLEKIPIAREAKVYAEEEGLDPEALALYGGEEYELVLTTRKESFVPLKRKFPSLIRIGTVEKGNGEVFVRSRGELRRVKPHGWEHMKSRIS